MVSGVVAGLNRLGSGAAAVAGSVQSAKVHYMQLLQHLYTSHRLELYARAASTL